MSNLTSLHLSGAAACDVVRDGEVSNNPSSPGCNREPFVYVLADGNVSGKLSNDILSVLHEGLVSSVGCSRGICFVLLLLRR